VSGRKLGIVLVLTMLAVTAAAAPARPVAAGVDRRLDVGFYDDPSFRWSSDTDGSLAAAHAAGATVIHVSAN
jgi:hypothetical protein